MVLMSVVNGSWPVPISELVFVSSPLSHENVATVSNLGPETNEASIEANNLAVVKPQTQVQHVGLWLLKEPKVWLEEVDLAKGSRLGTWTFNH